MKSIITEHPKTSHKLTNTIKLYFNDIKFPVKTRDIHKIEKKKSISISIFGYENRKNIQFMYQNNITKKNLLTYY